VILTLGNRQQHMGSVTRRRHSDRHVERAQAVLQAGRRNRDFRKGHSVLQPQVM
jgi:hypothetical protein